MDYVHFGPTQNILARLDEVERSSSFFALFGERATGKTHLMKYWREIYPSKERHLSIEHRPCLYIDLWRTHRVTLDRGTYVTPITNVLFNEILYQMGEQPWIQAKEIVNSRWYQPTGTLSTDSAFLSLLNFIRRFYARLTARLLIIDGAHLLDEAALEMLVRLRSYQRIPTGIAFCLTLEKNEKFNDALERFERKLPHRSRSLFHRRNALELLRLQDKEFVGTVLKAMFEQLEVDTTAETPAERARKGRVAQRAWQRTQGDWVSIRGLHEDFEVALGPTKGKQRRLTPEVLRRVFPDWEEVTI